MYRFDPELDFSSLIGCEVNQICIDQLSVIYNLHPSGMIASRGGAWRLLDGEGHSIDRNVEFTERKVFRVHSLLGQKIISCMIKSPNSQTTQIVLKVMNLSWVVKVFRSNSLKVAPFGRWTPQNRGAL